MISKINMKGFRGYENLQTLEIAIPNGELGSGLTVIVGPNNSGKSTLIENFQAIGSKTGPPSFTEGKRNKRSGDKIHIEIFDTDGNSLVLSTVNTGGSETEFINRNLNIDQLKIFTIPSRRSFNPYFNKGSMNRFQLLQSNKLKNQRNDDYNLFSLRMFEILKDPLRFNDLLQRIINPLPQWTIEQSDVGQFYVKFNYDGNYHSSDGAGEGLISVFTIVDALYDSEPGEAIVIDEPELSLHPALQRKMMDLMLDLSRTRQIIISTHSPYFIDWLAFVNGGTLARVVKDQGKSIIYQLDKSSQRIIKGILANFNNPHILGLDAREVFFLDDNINIVEGQEDIIFFKIILDQLKLNLQGNFFGWGIGGATNLENILSIFNTLGFKKIACILDGNMTDLRKRLSIKFENYHFSSIPTDDIRDKNEVRARQEVKGLIDSSGKNFKPEYREPIEQIVQLVNGYHSK